MKINKQVFKTVIENQPPEQAPIIKSLIDELIFISNTLDELKRSIEAEGATIEKQTGNGYKTVCENPALKGYNTTIKSFTTTTKALMQYLPEAVKEDDGFMEFINAHPRIKKAQQRQ